MTSSGESFNAEPAPGRPSREYQVEVLQTMQVAHSLRLRDEGTIERALKVIGDAIGEEGKATMGEQPAAHLSAFYTPQDHLWVSGIRIPEYRIKADGSIGWSPGWVVPISREVDGKLVSVTEGFNIGDAILVGYLRDDLIEARDNGILPDLGIDLTCIA